MNFVYRDGGTGRGAEGEHAPQILADQLTLSQPGGGQIMPPQFYSPPLRFADQTPFLVYSRRLTSLKLDFSSCSQLPLLLERIRKKL